MPEMVFELKVNTRFVHRRIGKHRFVDVTVGGEQVFAPGLGDEYFHGEWLIDATGFSGDISDGGNVSTVSVEVFEGFDD